MRVRLLRVLLLGCCLSYAGSALAQVTTTGTIQIVLVDQQNLRLPGVTITVSAPDVVTTRSAVTDAEGNATLEALAPSAKYTVKAQLSGFKDLTLDNVLVRSGQTVSIHETLQLSG